jgi:hypothetical protein
VADLEILIQRIHQSPFQVVLVVSGGGSQALADLLAIPGASKTLLEGLVPYSEKAVATFLGFKPEPFVSEETAVALAEKAYARALALRESSKTPVLGAACTATLVTDRPKKGEHRAYIAVYNGVRTTVCSLLLSKGARDRRGEERVVGDLMIRALARVCGFSASASSLLLPDERVVFHLGE